MKIRFGRSRLPELLIEKKMSQVEFAHRLNVSEGFVSKIISGDSKLSFLKARNAAEILGCSTDDLYEWEKDFK